MGDPPRRSSRSSDWRERVAEVRLVGGRLRELLGGSRVSIDAASVRELLDALARRGRPGLPALLWEDPQAALPRPHRDLRVLVNGRSVLFLAGLDTPLGEEDTVSLFLSGARGWPGG
jgi:molybdopterin converting factor small subunit